MPPKESKSRHSSSSSHADTDIAKHIKKATEDLDESITPKIDKLKAVSLLVTKKLKTAEPIDRIEANAKHHYHTMLIKLREDSIQLRDKLDKRTQFFLDKYNEISDIDQKKKVFHLFLRCNQLTQNLCANTMSCLQKYPRYSTKPSILQFEFIQHKLLASHIDRYQSYSVPLTDSNHPYHTIHLKISAFCLRALADPSLKYETALRGSISDLQKNYFENMKAILSQCVPQSAPATLAASSSSHHEVKGQLTRAASKRPRQSSQEKNSPEIDSLGIPISSSLPTPPSFMTDYFSSVKKTRLQTSKEKNSLPLPSNSQDATPKEDSQATKRLSLSLSDDG